MYNEIDILQWKKVGEGATADSYNNLLDVNIVLKLFHKERTKDEVIREYDSVKSIESLGLKTPRAIEIVTFHNQLGIIYERLVNKVSYSKLCADSPEKISEYAINYAKETEKLHEIKVDKQSFLNKKEQLIELIMSSKVTWKKDQDVLLKFINSIPDSNTAIHGDLHTGNLLLVNESDNYWIDIGDFGYGSFWFDIATLYLVCKEISGMHMIQDNLHLNKQQLSLFWDSFSKYYFKGEDLLEVNEKARIMSLFKLAQRIVYAGKNSFMLFLSKMIYGTRLSALVKKYESKHN